MKCPPLLIAAALLFWGWQTGYWPAALAMAGVVAAVPAVKRRWDLAPRDFHRIADGCALIFLALTVYRFAGATGSMARWLPMGLFPLLAAQAYSSVPGVDLGALFYTIRQREKKGEVKGRRTVDISFAYLALTLVAASAANLRTPVFFAGLVLFSGWGLWSVRPAGRPVGLWLGLLAVAGILGFGGQLGLHRLQVWLETDVIEWLIERDAERDPLQNRTAIGLIGKLKQSDRIVMRVVPEGSFKASLLLTEAVYNRYAGGVWLTDKQHFARLTPGNGQGVWSLGPEAVALRRVRISRYYPQGQGLVSLPAGTVAVTDLPAMAMERNGLGTLRVEGIPGLVNYHLRFVPDRVDAAPPEKTDLQVPGPEQALLERFLAENGLASLPAPELVAALKDQFYRHFAYRLHQDRQDIGSRPLARFLFESRAGHCEYFATATVLLLRAAGVPARYATGHLATEYSGLEKAFVVRDRHAHAWALAFVEGTWQTVDTTPGAWPEFDRRDSSWYRPAVDLASWAWLGFNGWRQHNPAVPPWLQWALLPTAAILAVVLVRPFFSSKRRASRQRPDSRSDTSLAPIPSPLECIEAFWAARGLGRRPWETLQRWVERLAHSEPGAEAVEGLGPIIDLHQRLRFHPHGLSGELMTRLHRQVEAYFKPEPK